MFLSLKAYYMDVKQVRDGNPPIDRQCRLCSRIGHFARNCTYFNKQEEEGKRLNDEEMQHVPPPNLEQEIGALINGPDRFVSKLEERAPKELSGRASPKKVILPWPPTPVSSKSSVAFQNLPNGNDNSPERFQPEMRNEGNYNSEIEINRENTITLAPEEVKQEPVEGDLINFSTIL